MKKLLLFIAMVLPLLAFAQPAGRIVYQEKVNLHRGLGPDQEEQKALIPEWQTSRAVLLYDGQASLYKAMEEDESEINREEGGAQINIRIRRGAVVRLVQGEKDAWRVSQQPEVEGALAGEEPDVPRLGVAYMLAGGSDPSNTDPMAMEPLPGEGFGTWAPTPAGANYSSKAN